MLQAGRVDGVNKLSRIGRGVKPIYPRQTDVRVENYVASLRVLVKTGVQSAQATRLHYHRHCSDWWFLVVGCLNVATYYYEHDL
jgi:hypothetical protein